MADKINNIEITKRETIKPCFQTPKHLRIVKLSLLDQISPDMYVPLILFYPFTTTNNNSNPQNPTKLATKRVQRLRETFSKVLSYFYPLAGRLRNNHFIECIDEGAEFVEAKAPFSMSKILKRPDPDTLKKFVVAQPESSQDSLGGRLLLVQATIFDCGGIAIGALFSHKIADACSIGGFVRSWAKISLDNEKLVLKPQFGTSCDIIPPILDSSSEGVSSMELVQDKCVTRRYVFTAEKIKTLKSNASSEDRVKNPTRVEAVSGLLWNCAIKASASRSTNDPGCSRKSFWYHAVNIRKRIVPPLGDNVVGNLAWGFVAKFEDQEVADIQVLAGKIRRGIEQEVENYSKKDYILGVFQEHLAEFANGWKNNEIDMYSCSSWCRFGLYEADFGWEKPTWVSVVSSEYKNSILLMDTRDGDGIEAWVLLSEQDMACIERDEELLAYALLNPSVV